MQIHITSSDGVPIFQQIVNQVRYLVASGRLAPGDQLPPVRKLAEQLLVNPNTVARAYRELDAAGVLSSRRGSGVFVADAASGGTRPARRKLLTQRADLLLAEARQLGFDLEELFDLLRDRHRRLSSERGETTP